MENGESICTNPQKNDRGMRHDDGDGGVRRDETAVDQNGEFPQLLSSPQDQHTETNETTREALENQPHDNINNTERPKFNNSAQGRHWNFTFNNYTEEDYKQIESAFHNDNKRSVVSACVGREGKDATPHLQGYVHFQVKKRQQTVFAFFGYDTPRFHLQAQDIKRSPPVASFRYCMKEGDYYVIGKNLDEIARAKKIVKRGTGCSGDDWTELTRLIVKGEIVNMAQVRNHNAELAAKQEEYWKGLIVQHMSKPPVTKHPLRPWQEALIEKLQEPFNDREVIFVIDPIGNSGKTWFTKYYEETYSKCIQVGADKRENLSYEVINLVIENGTPNVIFMDAPRARAMYVSASWLEEMKNGEVKSPKYKSKKLPLSHVPHVVVMMNEFPRKNSSDQGLSDDRYTYLMIDNPDNPPRWHKGFIDSAKMTGYETIINTVQSTLPNDLQDAVNRLYNSINVTDTAHQKMKDFQDGVSKIAAKWYKKESEPEKTKADKFVTDITSRATSRSMKEYVSSKPIEQYINQP